MIMSQKSKKEETILRSSFQICLWTLQISLKRKGISSFPTRVLTEFLKSQTALIKMSSTNLVWLSNKKLITSKESNKLQNANTLTSFFDLQSLSILSYLLNTRKWHLISL